MQGARKIYIPECLHILCMKEIKQQPASQPSIPPLVAKLGDDINVYSKGNSQQKRKGSASYRVRFNPSIVSCKIRSPDADLRHHYYYCLRRRKPNIYILQQLALAPTKRVGSQAAVSKNPSLPMCVCFFSEQRMAHSPSLIFNAIAEKTLQQNPFPPAEDFKLLPLILLVSTCSSSTRERGEKPNQKVTITTGGREGPKSNIPSISTMGFSTLILSKAMAVSKDDNEDNSCSRRSNKGLTKELTKSEREIERSWAGKSAKKNPFSIRRWEAKDTEKQMQTKSSQISRTGD